MNKNIDLGTFSWDISKIEQQIIENRKQIEMFSSSLNVNKKVLNEEKKEIQNLAVQISGMKQIQKEANDQLKKGTISQEEYNKTVSESNKVIQQNETRINEVAQAQSAHIKTIIDSENAIKGLRTQNAELNKLYSAGRTEISGNEGAYRDLNKELNALKIESKNLGAEMLVLERAGKKDTDQYKNLATQFAENSKKTNELNNDFKELDGSLGDNQRNVGAYQEAIKNSMSDIFDGLRKMSSGDVTGGLDSVKNGIGEISTSAKGLFNFLKANPWTLVLGAIVAIGREMWNYNKEIAPNVKLTETLFSRAGEKSKEYLDDVRNNISGLAETFNLEFKEVANAVDDLVDTGRVKDELEAIQIIKEAIVKAPDANEFINTLGETTEKAELTGLSLKQVIAAKMSLDATGGSNAFFDAMQKGYKSLSEGSDKLSKTLTLTLGAAFSNEILDGVRNGSLTTVEALEKIRKKGEEVGLDNQQQMNLAIQLFGKSSIAAGGYEKIMNNVGTAIKSSAEPLTELQQKTLDLINLNQELATAKDEAYKSDGVRSFQKTIEVVWKNIQIAWYRYIGQIFANTQRELDILKLAFLSVRDGIKVIPLAFGIVLSGILKDFRQLGDIARSVGNVVSAAFT